MKIYNPMNEKDIIEVQTTEAENLVVVLNKYNKIAKEIVNKAN